MRISYYIAKRYLFSKKRQHIINYMNMVSLLGVMFATAALIIVLSVFNGFGQLIHSLYSHFQPALLVQPIEGNRFLLQNFPTKTLQNIEGLSYITPIIEESALLRYEKRQTIVSLKGVEDNYMALSGMDSLMVQGYPFLQQHNNDFAILGYGVAYKLQVQLNAQANVLQLFLPKKGFKGSSNLQNAFRRLQLKPSGFFSVRQDFDDSYVFVPQHLLQATDSTKAFATAMELGIVKGADKDKVQAQVEAMLGSHFSVKNRLQQQAVMQKVMQSEKAMVFLVLGFILLLAIFNIIGSISMLIVDKKPDMATLKALGASKPLILSIFAWEGVLISLAGGVVGMLLGAAIAFGQQHFGWISLGEGNFIVEAYPVKLMWQDFISVLLMLIIMSSLAIIYPLRQLAKLKSI